MQYVPLVVVKLKSGISVIDSQLRNASVIVLILDISIDGIAANDVHPSNNPPIDLNDVFMESVGAFTRDVQPRNAYTIFVTFAVFRPITVSSDEQPSNIFGMVVSALVSVNVTDFKLLAPLNKILASVRLVVPSMITVSRFVQKLKMLEPPLYVRVILEALLNVTVFREVQL